MLRDVLRCHFYCGESSRVSTPPTEHRVNLVNMTSSHVWLGGVKKTPPVLPLIVICVCLYADKNNLACSTDLCIISCSMKCPAYYTVSSNVASAAALALAMESIVFISKTSCRDVHVVENYMLPSLVS